MNAPIKSLQKDDAKFVSIGAFWGEHGLPVSASGKAICIDGEYWPASQLRLGGQTDYGLEIHAARWLVAKRGASARAAYSQGMAQLATKANVVKADLYGPKN